MGAGDSLDEVADLDLERLRVAAANAKIPFAAQIDYQDREGRWRQVLGATGQLSRLREANSSRPEVLEDFLEDGIEQCDAEHYIVMLWGHGSGPGGFFSDGSKNTPAKAGGHPLSPRQLANALARVSDRKLKRKFDVLLLKACFGATVEIAYQLDTAAEFIIASQSLIPGQTFWPYPRIFDALRTAPLTEQYKQKGPEYVATQVVDILGRFYANDANRPGKSEVPYSLLRTESSKDVADSLTELVKAWRDAGSPDLSEVASRCSPSDPGLIDIARFCQTLVDVGHPEVTDAAKRLRQAVANLVVTRNPEVSAFRGVSAFYHPGYGVPSPARDTASYGLYTRSKLAQHGRLNPGQTSVGSPESSWVDIAFQNTAIARLAQDFLPEEGVSK
jgi:hypothetical protein